MDNIRGKIFALTLLLIFNQCVSAGEKKVKPQLINLKDSAQISFSIPDKKYIHLKLLPNKSDAHDNITANLYLTGEGCTMGYKGVLNYKKNDKETLFTYFTKETSWDSIGTLIVTQDKKTNDLSITLNGETIKVSPKRHANFLSIDGNPPSIKIESIEPSHQRIEP